MFRYEIGLAILRLKTQEWNFKDQTAHGVENEGPRKNDFIPVTLAK